VKSSFFAGDNTTSIGTSAARRRILTSVRWLAFHPGTTAADRRRVSVVLAVAVLGISSSAVLVRGMDATPVAIAAWRTAGAALLLSPALPRALSGLTRRDLAWAVLGGALLGLHFWAWFASLGHTTVLRSTLLVCLVPAWSAALDWALRGRRPSAGLWLGLGLALPGLALLAGAGGRATWTGDVFSVVAGWLWALTLAILSHVRQRVDAAATMALTCGAAAAVLFPVAVATGAPLAGWPATTWLLLAAAVLGPQLIGHQGFAYALRWVPASTVAVLALLEPVGASSLAFVILGETPGFTSIVGGALVLLGVGCATRSRMGTGGPGSPVPPRGSRYGCR
jgi:drug/metabolite transporter (DMT)-like permease